MAYVSGTTAIGSTWSPSGNAITAAWQGNDVSLVPELSGTSNVGSAAKPFGTVYAQSLSSSGVSAVFTTSILPNASGTLNVGSTATPFSGVFGSPILKDSNGVQWKITVSTIGNISGVAF